MFEIQGWNRWSIVEFQKRRMISQSGVEFKFARYSQKRIRSGTSEIDRRIWKLHEINRTSHATLFPFLLISSRVFVLRSSAKQSTWTVSCFAFETLFILIRYLFIGRLKKVYCPQRCRHHEAWAGLVRVYLQPTMKVISLREDSVKSRLTELVENMTSFLVLFLFSRN